MKTKTSRSAGSALLLAMLIVMFVAVVVAASLEVTSATNRFAQRTVSNEAAQEVGEACIDWAFGQWRKTYQGAQNQVLAGSSFTISAPPSSVLPEVSKYTVTMGLEPVDPCLNDAGASGTPAGSRYASASDNSYFYLCYADVTAPAPINQQSSLRQGIFAKVRRVFEKRISSPWQYAIFYTDELEFHPSPVFTVSGPVWSNGSIYASPDGGNSLTFTSNVNYMNDYLAGYGPGDYLWRNKTPLPGDQSPWPNTKAHIGVAPGDTFAAGMSPQPGTAAQNPFGINPNQFSASDPNDTGYHEIVEKKDPNYTDTFTAQDSTSGQTSNPRYYDSAGVRITIDANNNISVLDSSGNAVSTTSTLYQAVSPAISTNTTIQDNRESATNSNIRLVTIDVSKLMPSGTPAGTNAASTIPGWNNVIWISDQSAGTTTTTSHGTTTTTYNKRGVKIKNGATVPLNGLTIVSDNPIYLQGDFNTLGTRQSTAIVGDAINVLSNNWVDSNSSADVNSRVATATTVNAAFLSGNVPTLTTYSDNRAYSGGVENFPRFLESWSNVTFTYRGSMVEMFQSQQATGRWASASYNPPIRNWAFDPLLQTTPPPGTLLNVTYIKQRCYQN